MSDTRCAPTRDIARLAVRLATVALLFYAPCGSAVGASPLPTPASVAKGVSVILDGCVKKLQCDENPCASNGGLKYCYSVAQTYWSKKLEAAQQMLANRDEWCASHWRNLEEQHAAFRERAMAIPSLGDGPYNTDDDLDLLLAQQQYELAYQVLNNSACAAPTAENGAARRK